MVQTKIPRNLLGWYDQHARVLPWRCVIGERPDPYAIWLSEIMLQQTTVKAVTSYFAKFLSLWPRVEDLARAELDDVLRAWAGLGYYARARNLHACAQKVVQDYAGKFPDTIAGLLALPGIGPYTSAAIMAIAFDKPANVVDGNVERVISRLFAVKTPLPGAKPELVQLAAKLSPKKRPGDYAQAMMDLGATVCTPTSPSCPTCPLSQDCKAQKMGTPVQFPFRLKKGKKPVRRGVSFLVQRGNGDVLLRRRPNRGLLASMMEVPGSKWESEFPDAKTTRIEAPIKADWSQVENLVTHTFTHFHLELKVFHTQLSSSPRLRAIVKPADCRWVAHQVLHEEALPSLMRKVISQSIEFKDGT